MVSKGFGDFVFDTCAKHRVDLEVEAYDHGWWVRLGEAKASNPSLEKAFLEVLTKTTCQSPFIQDVCEYLDRVGETSE